MPTNGVPLRWPGPVYAINFRGFKPGYRPSVTNGVVLELNYNWPDPGQPPPPPAPPPCAKGETPICGGCALPPVMPKLVCPSGQKVDFIVVEGDDGSCACDEYCASNWNGEVKGVRPHWSGAVSATNSTTHCHGTGHFAPCFCVQASHWCNPQNMSVGAPSCSASCDHTGVPQPQDYCIPV
eukprot:COSAG02_NODE_2941_length_7696_cov_10.082533_2_plen_181_part_00